MSFSLSGSTVTQSGTDTSYSGLAGVSGVSAVARGDGYLYVMTGLTLEVTGSLTIANPAKESFLASRFVVKSSGVFTSGSFASDGATPLTSGCHFEVGYLFGTGDNAPSEIGHAAFGVEGSGQFTTIGGSYIASNFWFANNAKVREYGTDAIANRAFGSSSGRFRSFSTDVVLRNCRHFDCSFDMFRVPTEFSVKAFGAEYVAQYVGGAYAPALDGDDAKFVASALSNADGTFDFDDYTGGWVELEDCAKGINLNVVTQQPSADHCVPLFQNVQFTVSNLSGTVQQYARFRCIDSPSTSPSSVYNVRGGKSWDFRSAITYSGTTNSQGKVSARPALAVWYGSSSTRNVRFPSSTAIFRFAAYGLKQQDVSVVLGADAPIARAVALTAVGFLTLTESQAAALSGISLSASGATGGTVTISASRSVAELWQFYRQWIATVANFDSSDTWSFDGDELNIGAWNLVVNSGVTLTGSISTAGSVTLTGTGAVDGLYASSAGASARLRLTGLASATVAVFNAAGVQQDLQTGVTGTYTRNIAPGATGTWTWVVKRAGFEHASGTFTPGSGGLTSTAPSMPQKLNPDGSAMYQGTTSTRVDVSFSGTTTALIDIGNGPAALQAIFDESEQALVTAAGMAWLAAGKDDITQLNSASGDYLFLTQGWRIRRRATTDDNATVNAFVQSSDTAFIDASNGQVQFLTSDTPTAIAQAVWAMLIDGSTTAAQSLRLSNSVLGGKVSGAGTGTERFRDLADGKDRVQSTVDSSGNRSAVALDLS